MHFLVKTWSEKNNKQQKELENLEMFAQDHLLLKGTTLHDKEGLLFFTPDETFLYP